VLLHCSFYRVGQERMYWPYIPYICISGDFPAKYNVNTPIIYGSEQPCFFSAARPIIAQCQILSICKYLAYLMWLQFEQDTFLEWHVQLLHSANT
jgi:hypothetical protein